MSLVFTKGTSRTAFNSSQVIIDIAGTHEHDMQETAGKSWESRGRWIGPSQTTSQNDVNYNKGIWVPKVATKTPMKTEAMLQQVRDQTLNWGKESEITADEYLSVILHHHSVQYNQSGSVLWMKWLWTVWVRKTSESALQLATQLGLSVPKWQQQSCRVQILTLQPWWHHSRLARTGLCEENSELSKQLSCS